MKKGFSVVEILLAIALFVIFSSGVATLVIGGLNSNRQASEQAAAIQYATEGMEAVRSIRNRAYGNLLGLSGNQGLAKSGGVWSWSGNQNVWDKYTRTIAVSAVLKDGQGNIVTSGGTEDPEVRKITVTVAWPGSGGRTNSFVQTGYLSKWSDPIDTSVIGGMAVFASGGTTTDALSYQILNNTTGTWSTVATLPDVHTGSTNRVARVVKLYSSVTRNEKVMISKHVSGTTEYLYSETWNGTSWSTPTLLMSSSINALYIDNRNYDATYLNNGDLMVVYGDSTTTPKFRIWNGSTWAGAVNLPSVGGIPVYVALRSRLGTNEVMAVFFDQLEDTNTTYFNGTSYTLGAWSAVTEHATTAPTTTKEHVDFTWSQYDYMRGAMIYPSGNNDKNIYIKIWIANGQGSGNWGNGAQSANIPARLGPTVGRSNSRDEQYISCTKETNNAIYCYESDGTPSWLTPTNYSISGGSHSGAQRSFDVGWKTITGNRAIVVYSDNTAVPKYKKYDPAIHIFDNNATSIGSTPMPSTLVMVKICQQGFGDDMMVLMSDVNRNLYRVQWNGTAEVMYTTGGRAFGALGSTAMGSTSTSYWFDFAWDTYY